MSSRHVFLRQASSGNRRRPLLKTHVTDCKDRVAEVAGGTAAECAAVCCCCPCGLVNLLVLVIYKVPVRLCRRVMRKNRRQRLIKKGLLPPRHVQCTCGCDGLELQFHPVGFESLTSEFKAVQKLVMEEESSDEDVIQLEKEMWDRFYGTGFWRSPTQRETPSISNSNSNSNSKMITGI
ncbi:uncharacterized protein LOC133721669 [Rosa rugosa]|uniref:uncharacterized protein LOC133721669 n=1 Tax=Rosa rugosa TaxID=74645 RepID=UPI002B40FCD3|nr:uncharacterized protein LOC133721669 [Rosa rugosa]